MDKEADTNKVKLFHYSRQIGVKLGDAENLQTYVKPRRCGKIQSSQN